MLCMSMGGIVTLFEYRWRGKGISLKIVSIPGEGKGLFKVFDYTRSMYVGAHVSYCIIALK